MLAAIYHTIRCYWCGARNPPDSTRCLTCGRKMED